jgi:phosphotransferase system enzyme I (PtsI)
MVTLAEEMARVRELLENTAEENGIRQLPPLGAMVETPAAALCAGEIVRHADFLSIGTNDLTQYTMVAGRENPLVSDYFIDDHPAMRRLLQMVIDDAGDVPVSICGELAGRREGIKTAVECGIRCLSVAPPLIPTVKDMIRELHT